MQNVSELLKELPVDTDTSRLKLNTVDTSNNTTDVDRRGYWQDRYIDHVYSDLINQQYRGWYVKRFYELGKAKVEAIAEQARKGNHPQRLFSKLVKNG